MIILTCSICGTELTSIGSTITINQDIMVELQCPECSKTIEDLTEENNTLNSHQDDYITDIQDLMDANYRLSAKVVELETFIDEYISN